MPLRGFPRIPSQVIASQSIGGPTRRSLRPVCLAHVPTEWTPVLEDSNLPLMFCELCGEPPLALRLYDAAGLLVRLGEPLKSRASIQTGGHQ